MLELQLQAASQVVATTSFATTMLTEGEWTQLKLTCSSAPGGHVQCYVKLRGAAFLERPSAPPPPSDDAAAALFQEAM